MVVMKVRSCVLVACMLVVPALALFSHLTPPAARDFLRCSICDPLCQAISVIDAALPFGSNTALPGGFNGPTPKPSAQATPLVTIAAEAAVPSVSQTPAGGAVTAVEPVLTKPLPAGTISEVAVAASPTADHDVPRSQAEWAALATLRGHLATLGATAIDCRPQPGALPGYSSSCRLGIDTDGQLHRMFHGRGPDAAAAMQSLVDQIQSWRIQHAAAPRQRF
jgi:hypothetical protein